MKLCPPGRPQALRLGTEGRSYPPVEEPKGAEASPSAGMAKNFAELLDRALLDHRTFLTVGLDPRPGGIPAGVGGEELEALRGFLLGIIEATRDYCVAFKMQLASYLAFGPGGMDLLAEVRAVAARDRITILDLKASDIPSTMELYRSAVLERWGFDAMTVNPYLGWETISAALKEDAKGLFVLLHTSNAGAQDFEERTVDGGPPLWRTMIPRLRELSMSGNIGAVVGATFPEALTEARQGLGTCVPLLVPGVGRQGGSLEDVLRSGRGESGGALLINASRSILEASRGSDWKEAAAAEAAHLTRAMRDLRPGPTGTASPAGPPPR